MAELTQELLNEKFMLKKKLEKAKKIRAKLVNYDYRNCKSISFEKMTTVIHDLYDKINSIQRIERVEYEKTEVHKYLMSSKKMNGKHLLIKLLNK